MNLLPMLEPIRDDLEAVEARMLAAVRQTHEPLSAALCAVLASGGKRLRPAIVVLSARIHSWDADQAISLAAAVEMLHTATLIHDDTIDQAAIRRGQKTLNAQWSREAAILAGDFLFARAVGLAAEADNTRVARVLADSLTTICDGELAQMLALNDWHGGREDYYRRIYSKTASLFATAAEVGALIGRAPEEEVRTLRAYGENLGMAFQIVDDILDYAGEEAQLGKPTGGDLRQGIATLPVYHYLQRGGREDLVVAALERNVASADQREPAVQALMGAVLNSGAIEACREEAHRFARHAAAALEPLEDSPYRRTLGVFAEFAVLREA